MKVYRLGSIHEKKKALEKLGVESGGIAIMAKKMELYYFYLKDLRTPAANILKQDALSIGAELAVPGGVITCETDYCDAILIGHRKHIETLSKKEQAQPFGLKKVALLLRDFLKEKEYPVRLMGVVNANDDSFYAGSRFKAGEAAAQIERMIGEGAEIIDIGAVSSRPGAAAVPVKEELGRIIPVCDALAGKKLYGHALFSIDSTTPEVIEYALKSGFGMVNDIGGADNDAIVKLAVDYGAKLCIMHMQGTPQTMQANPHYEDVMAELDDFFEERIARCEAMGLPREMMVLDVGIGFGKSLENNITLIKNLKHFSRFGCEILIGASRKSMIDRIISSTTEERLPGTLAIHLKAVENGASIIRCHDVAEHRQALAVYQALR